MKRNITIIIFIISINNFNTEAGNNNSNPLFSFVGGFNYSSFYKYNNWGINYSFGILPLYHINDKISIAPLFTYSKISSLVTQLEGIAYTGDFGYRTYYDLVFEASFLELNVMSNYRVFQQNKIQINYGFSFGYSLGLKDYSDSKIKIITNEIVEDYSERGSSTDPIDQHFTIENNGFILGTNFMLKYNKFSLIPIYTVKLFKIKDINKIRSFSVLFAFWL